MKKYKGWEIAKLISEGKLEGKTIQIVTGTSGDVSNYNWFLKVNSRLMDRNIEVGNSYLTDAKSEFIIVQEPVTFMDCVDSKSEVRVDHILVNEFFKHIHISMDLNTVLFHITNHLESAADLKKVILEGKWYIEEDLSDGE